MFIRHSFHMSRYRLLLRLVYFKGLVNLGVSKQQHTTYNKEGHNIMLFRTGSGSLPHPGSGPHPVPGTGSGTPYKWDSF